jgi:hypothetical protein
VDDGTCRLGGCTDSRAANFLAVATYDDGSCVVIFEGCTDSMALNHRAKANVDDSSCVYVGCMLSIATNFDPSASFMGYCEMPIAGCMSSLADNYNPGPCAASSLEAHSHSCSHSTDG